MTALALAAKAGYNDIVVQLLSQGAYLNIVDKVGQCSQSNLALGLTKLWV